MQELEFTFTQIFSCVSDLIPKFKPVFFILFVWFSFRLAVSLVKVLCQPPRRSNTALREARREARQEADSVDKTIAELETQRKSKQAINECIWFTGDCSKCRYYDDCYLVKGGTSHDRS